MSPSAVTPPQSTAELTNAGVKHDIEHSAPSMSTNGSSNLHELDASKLIFTRNPDPRPLPESNSPEVWAQNVCTDHMITVSWNFKTGWAAPELRPYGPLTLMPTASVLHYATECFEGMKFYRGYDGGLRLFRPDRNCRRMLGSAARIALPAFDPTELQKLIQKLVSVDGGRWLPKGRPGEFLYLRPTMIANGAGLGVQKPKEALLYIIAVCFPAFDGPSGTQRMDPTQVVNGNGDATVQAKKPGLKLLASREDMFRAWPGGFGYAKLGANYGPSLIAQAEAKARVWRTREGKMQLVTAPLQDKIILDGVTRGSILELVEQRLSRGPAGLGILEIVERKYTMGEIEEAAEEGRLVEAFAAGTAFFVAPVSLIHFRGKDLDIPLSEGTAGKFSALIKTWLKNIMYGEERHKWGVVVEEANSKA